MIGGIGNVLFSTYSQTLNKKDSAVTFGELLEPVITLSELFLVGKTGDERRT